MMKNVLIRRSEERGYFDHDWLKTYHTFSFADYYNPNFMEFGSLRVINDDVISPKTGFGLHPHRNMEIITYILNGTLTHGDSLGNKEDIRTGQVQLMSAGSGIVHSEWNHGDTPCHLLQIWINPNQGFTNPSYKIYTPDHFEKWGLVASGMQNSSVEIKQDAEIYVINSGTLQEVDLPDSKMQMKWIHIATGEAEIGNILLRAGDAIGLLNGEDLGGKIKFKKSGKILLFNV